MDLQSQAQASGLGPGPWDFGLAFLVDSAAYPPRLGAIHRVIPHLAPEEAARLAAEAFTVEKLATARVDRRCTTDGQKGCPVGGKW